MRERGVWVLTAGVLAVTGLVASGHLGAWGHADTSSLAHREGKVARDDCASCHQGEIPLSHHAKFVAFSHGAAARVQRTSCISCHDEQKHCQSCHGTIEPPWHTEKFKNPGRGRDELLEHARIALRRETSCQECHATRFQVQCASCHRTGEGGP